MLASARVQQLHARHAAQPCTAHKHLPTALGHRGPENTFPQPLTPNTNSMVPSCIVLTSLDAKMRQLQPLLAEAQARHIARVYVTTPGRARLHQTILYIISRTYKLSMSLNMQAAGHR